jgi:hypothetical protein
VSDFTPRQPVLFELNGELLQGWYVSQFGAYNSTVTLEPPETWLTTPDGKVMPAAYTRQDDEIRLWISPERAAEIKSALDGSQSRRDTVESLPEYDATDIRNGRSGVYVLADGSVITVSGDSWEMRPPRPLTAR